MKERVELCLHWVAGERSGDLGSPATVWRGACWAEEKQVPRPRVEGPEVCEEQPGGHRGYRGDDTGFIPGMLGICVTAGSERGELTSVSGAALVAVVADWGAEWRPGHLCEVLAVEQGEVRVAQMRVVAAEGIRSGWGGDIF